MQHARTLDLLSVDLRAVGAASVFDGPLAVVEDEARVGSRDGAIENQHVVAGGAADGRDILMQDEVSPGQHPVEEGQPTAQRSPVWAEDAVNLGARAGEIVAAVGAVAVLLVAHRPAAETRARGTSIAGWWRDGWRRHGRDHGGDSRGGCGHPRGAVALLERDLRLGQISGHLAGPL